MAQERARRARRVAGRYGLAGRVAAAVALAALVAALAIAGALGSLGPGPFSIERNEVAEGTGKDVAEEVSKGPAEGEDPAEGDAVQQLTVHVDGAVALPGVYVLAAGSRVVDAVEAAGGLAEGADTTSVNLAAPLEDGAKVHVPLEGEEVSAGGALGSQGAAAGPVNINTAGVDELDSLPGIGEATALAIIEDREANGPFATTEDLMRVSGIGEKKYARLEGLICV